MKTSTIRRFLEAPSSLEPLSAAARAEWDVGYHQVLVPAMAAHGLTPLRPAQIQAFTGIASHRTALVLGPPGTGKTTLLGWMALAQFLSRRRAGQPCRILVTAFTRAAIINLLESVRRSASAIGEDVRPVFFGRVDDDAAPEGVEIVEGPGLPEILKRLHAIIGMTTWSVLSTRPRAAGAGAFAETFDLLCLDEASQMTVGQGLSALAPLRDDARIIVAGDDRQLAPIDAALEWTGDVRGLGGSLYAFLKTAAVPEFQLTETFRLNRPLAAPPAELFYDEYRSAVPDRRLQLTTDWADGLPEWLHRALDPENPVCILLHEGPPTATRSPLEAAIVADLVAALAPRLVRSDGQAFGEHLWAEGLAVVTPHRAHNALVRASLAERGFGDRCLVETVERMQGRERDAIVLSYAVADPEFAAVEGGFLFSQERFNVAITRPRSKLIIVVSRRLLEVVSPDEDVLDSVHVLREYVFGSERAASFEHRGSGVAVSVDVRVRRFDDSVPLPAIAPVHLAVEPLPALTPQLQEVERTIRREAEANPKYASAPDWLVQTKLARQVGFTEYRDLFRHGMVAMDRDQNDTYWRLRPVDPPQRPMDGSEALVRENYRTVIEDLKYKDYPALYGPTKRGPGVRDRFLWCDAAGNDLLWPMFQRLEAEGLVRLDTDRYGRRRVDLVDQSNPEPLEASSLPNLSDNDFRLLNALEDVEIRRIDLGVLEAWVSGRELADVLQARPELRAVFGSTTAVMRAVERLEAHGFLMNREGRLRSRMAELARELLAVKQRFRAGDGADRPFLVRALKVLAVTRDKPVRNVPMDLLIHGFIERWRNAPDVERVLRAITLAVARAFALPAGETPRLSGFQARAFETLVSAWLEPGKVRAAVVTADTGAGKTEAACLPLLAGAALDRLRGVQGARTVFVYPRIRLAINQAARLADYASELSRLLGVTITVGLQAGPVPSDWQWLERDANQVERAAPEWERHAHGGWHFPLFPCPRCERPLRIVPAPPDAPADRLECPKPACWSFDGWAGTKATLRRAPPALFLTVTESLHQWMQDPEYGRLFGDSGSPPRAVVADEIHLYAHVQGAQVGWALQRLLGRSKLNGQAHPIAIGMSATLGDPAEIWGDLAGVPADQVVAIRPEAPERLENPRGREYFFFVQPEVESRGKEVAGAATTIQSLMVLAHGMRRRSGREGGYRALVFLDSLDKVKRVHADYDDAESGKRLARLRTRNFGPDPQVPGQIRKECCREPETCDRFRDAECWYFAATDTRQIGARGRRKPGDRLLVSPKTISSQSQGNVERMIAESDVVFATSSLEVGFDDPDVSLVYQHYAPGNLASFVQRKGRGGRGSDDRPLTGVTLSVHSARDSWFFQEPRRMLEAADYRVPINMRNFFVRRGQVLSALLDFAARWAHQTGWIPTSQLPRELLGEADAFVRKTFGESIYAELETPSLEKMWHEAVQRAERAGTRLQGSPRKWREALVEVPTLLFDPINVPLLTVAPQLPPPERQGRGGRATAGERPAQEDVSLGLSECAPGRITRRWGLVRAHWFPFLGARAPWSVSEAAVLGEFSLIPGATPEDLLRHLPLEVRAVAGTNLNPKVARPQRLEPTVAGSFNGTNWEPNWVWDEAGCKVEPSKKDDPRPPIHHKSVASLRGFVVAAEDDPPEECSLRALDGFAHGRLKFHVARRGARSGLRMTQAFWASDVELVLDLPKPQRVYQRQVLSNMVGGVELRLHGYGMQPEGLKIDLEDSVIDAFLQSCVDLMDRGSRQSRWHRGQHLRYAVMARMSEARLTRFEGRQLADLCITAAAVPELKVGLEQALRRSNPRRLSETLQDAWRRHLSEHPQLGELRMKRLLERLEGRGAMDALKRAVEDVGSDAAYAGYLRSALMYGLLVRLRQLFIVHGRTEDRRVIVHARLPIQFGSDASPTLVVAERGSGGDGTTRAFLEVAEEVLQAWRDEGLVRCPNAATDRVVDEVFARRGEHERWRSRDPRSETWTRELAAELGLEPATRGAALQVVLRLLYDAEELQGQRFERFRLCEEVREARGRLAAAFGREPSEWELVGSVVHEVASGSNRLPLWRALHEAYRAVAHPSEAGPMTPEARLADQIHRTASRLCIDGCQGCLHGGTDVLDEELAEAVASRSLLEAFGRFVLAGSGQEMKL